LESQEIKRQPFPMAQPKASAIFYDLASFYSTWKGGGKVPPLCRHSVPFMDGFER